MPRPVCIASNACFFYCSNCCSSFMVISLTLSPILSKSPSIKVIGSNDYLDALVFFRCPSFSYSLCHFTRKGVLSRSPPPCFDCSSSSVWGEEDFLLLSEPCSYCSACSFAVHSTSAWAFSSVSFFLFSSKCCTFNCSASFLCFFVDLLVPMAKSDAVWKSTCHHLRTSMMASSVAK